MLLSTHLLRFDKAILSVIWLLLSMYLTARQGILFLFPLRNSYIVFLATIRPIQATVATEWISHVHTRY